MPQLNVETFVTQYIWLVILLGISYYKAVNSKELAEIFKLRRKSTKIVCSIKGSVVSFGFISEGSIPSRQLWH